MYWGYDIDLTIKDGRGEAKISDQRSTFKADDVLQYRTSGRNQCEDVFGGKYLSFIHTGHNSWTLILDNPVNGDHFEGHYTFPKPQPLDK